MNHRRTGVIIGLCSLVLLCISTATTWAQSTSPNYRVEESFFGTGGEHEGSSTNYRARQSAGEMTVGNAWSSNYQFQGGFNTSDDPLLEFAVDGGLYDLGLLDASDTGVAVAQFSVRNYLSSGYAVFLSGSAPTAGTTGGTHTLAALTAASPSTPGVEQFGVNLVDNSNPNVGSDPVQVPDNTYGFGSPASDYSLANTFKFLSGDIIASSPKSSGQTNYALSIIANVARETPSGQYGGKLNVQVVPMF